MKDSPCYTITLSINVLRAISNVPFDSAQGTQRRWLSGAEVAYSSTCAINFFKIVIAASAITVPGPKIPATPFS